jgi:uncharacterized protein (TIGR02145 family)
MHLFTLAVILAVIILSTSDSGADYVCGDANGDGTLNVSDAVYVVNYIFIGGPAPDPNCCESDCPPAVVDQDGNTYLTVEIDDQCWMAHNLKVTHYRNGDPIEHVTDPATWSGLTTGAYCSYNNDESHVAAYGMMYNWYAVNDSRNLAPEGWHVATEAEYETLTEHLGGCAVAGGKLKEAGTAFWALPNADATNESGFTGLPGGYCNQFGSFHDMRNNGVFWSASEYDSENAIGYALYHASPNMYYGIIQKNIGQSVRCVKD